MQKHLEEESASLENAEFIKSSLLKSANTISEGDANLLSGLATVKQQLQSLVKFGETYKSLGERANSLYIELKELAKDIDDTESKWCLYHNNLEEINTQLDKLNRFLKNTMQ
ncbi:MAG: hypothetical protein IPJ32_01635 [Sphingobacteriaceae bacterium]|nr:hypothetical protein [Sphingobacteriaceae bacterium]